MKNYFTVRVFGNDINGKKVSGCHIIKAKSRKDALRIREKYGISNPRFAEGDLRIRCDELRLEGKMKDWNLELLERRKQGFGGSIWYEDENGELQIET